MDGENLWNVIHDPTIDGRIGIQELKFRIHLRTSKKTPQL